MKTATKKAPPKKPAPKKTATKKYVPFTLVSQNIPERADDKLVHKHLEKILTQPPGAELPVASIAAFQEFGSNINEFELWFPNWWIGTKNHGEAIAFDRKQWELIEFDSFLSTPSTQVGAKGAGPNKLGGKRVTWALLRQISTGNNVLVYVVHAVASNDLGKQPGAVRSRKSLFQEHMRETAAKISSRDYPTMLVGDFNAAAKDPDLNPLRKAGLVLLNDPGVATHGRRQIDLGWRRDGRKGRLKLKKLAAVRLAKVLKDDHYGMAFTMIHHK